MGIFDYSKNDIEYPTVKEKVDNHVGPRERDTGIEKRFPVLWNPNEESGLNTNNWLYTTREEYLGLAKRINHVVEDGRDKSLALTALEEAYHRTVRAILA